jgi:hypothetical protein
MSQRIVVELEMPDDLEQFTLPAGVNQRLRYLLDKQDQGEALTDDERAEAEGLVDFAEVLSLLKLRVQRASQGDSA